MHKVVVTSDPRRQVLLMKKRSKEASEKKLAEENERLRKLNEKKDKGPLADAENEDLRAKVQKAQQEEEDKMRANAANVAARAAVGADDMLTKWQLLAAEGLAKRQGGGATSRSLLFPPQTVLCHSTNRFVISTSS
jgi:transcription initiation factor TFIID subunit 4